MSNQDIKIMSLEGFIDKFNQQNRIQQNKPFCFILGAGASVSSKIPSGKELATTWLETLYKEAPYPKPSLAQWATEESLGIEGFDYEQRATFYSEIYEKLFGKDPDSGYAFLEDAMSQKEPGVGYSFLAYFLAKTQHKVVITTNFDNLVADAVSIYTDTFPLVLGDQSLARYASDDVRRPLIAKIHGALGFTMRNSKDDVGELAEEWRLPLKEIFARYTPIVIGYDGNDGGLMGMLRKMPKGSINTIYWCKYWRKDDTSDLIAELNPPIREVLHRHQGTVIPILGFDETMVALQKAFDPPIPDMLEVLEQKHSKRVDDYNNRLADILKNIQNAEKNANDASLRDSRKESGPNAQEQSEKQKISSTTIALKKQLSELEKAMTAIAERQKVLPWWEWQRRVDQAHDSEAKEKIFNRALEQSPKDSNLRVAYGVFLFKEGREEDAIAQMQKAVDLDPKNANAFYNCAVALYKKGSIEEAETYYKRAIEADPKYAAALNNYAILLSEKGNTNEAETYYKRAIDADLKYAVALNNYGALLEKQGNTDEAETYFKRAIDADPKYAVALNNYGALLDKKGNTDEAETFYKKAIEADPKYAAALNNYGLLLSEKGNTDEAETYYKKAIEADPKYATALYNYAVLLEQKDMIQEAETYYKRAIEADPKDAAALNNYGLLLSGKGNADEAETYFKRAIEADPKYAMPLINYANLLERKGDLEEAENYFNKAVEADAKDGNDQANLAHLYFRKKDMKLAFKQLEIAESIKSHGKAAQVEMLFYRLAYDKKAWPVRLKEMRDLFAAGARSPNWPLDKHIENAKGLEHPNVELLQAIANVASKGEPISSLERFAEWPKSEK